MNQSHSGPGRKKPRVLLIVVLVLVLALIGTGALGLYYLHLWRSGAWTPSPELKEFIQEVADSTELKARAKALKTDLQDLTEAVKQQDLSAAREARERMRQDMTAMRGELDAPVMKAASLSADLRAELQSAEELLALLEEADSRLIGPGLELMERQPLGALHEEEGLRVDALVSYLDFFDEALPETLRLMDRAGGLDLRLMDAEGKLKSYQKKLTKAKETLGQLSDSLPALRAVLGGGEDRLYLFAAQNSSEIRASGGFPGSMGLIRIQNGLLTVSDFQSVYQVLSKTTPGRAAITQEEELLFSGRMHLSWDSDFSPDFERAASIWAMAYEDHHGEAVDGVISCTPAVIPRLLEVLGEVELSDGTVLDGENAGRVLGHDLYFRYLGAAWQAGAPVVVDGLFAEAARGTLELLFSQLDGKTLTKLLPLLRDGMADRTMMVWLADGDEQALIRAAGWDAGLNRDETHPVAGVFFNSTVSSKMAWFLDLETELSEPEKNEDGSESYTLTLTLRNVITPEERAAAGGYILGTTGGITGSLYLFAPAGGTVSEAVTEGGVVLPTASYEGLGLAYILQLTVGGEPIVIRCRITTSPAAEAPLGLMTTPTMQEFR